jgi:hypothetical protein
MGKHIKDGHDDAGPNCGTDPLGLNWEIILKTGEEDVEGSW